MKNAREKFMNRYRTFRLSRAERSSALFMFVLFLISIVANYSASIYATHSASNTVTDIILSNTPAFDVDGILVYGATAMALFILFIIVIHPKRIVFALQSLGLFFFTRAIFISLTHLRTFPTHTPVAFFNPIGAFLGRALLYGDDLFFSGHTGIPFLMALLFWPNKLLRYFFLACSVFFAIAVLLGHVHYTIDVASAFFITYGVYKIACYLFPRDYALFLLEE